MDKKPDNLASVRENARLAEKRVMKYVVKTIDASDVDYCAYLAKLLESIHEYRAWMALLLKEMNQK